MRTYLFTLAMLAGIIAIPVAIVLYLAWAVVPAAHNPVISAIVKALAER